MIETAVTESAAVQYLASKGYDLQPQTLRAWRHRRKGPAYVKPPGTGKIRYRLIDLDAFIEGGRVVPGESKRKPQRRRRAA
jgi:hypothetical protein